MNNEILIDKAYKSYNRLSRYQDFPYFYHTVDNKYIYGTTANLDDTTSYSEYVVKAGDTIDFIALQKYNDPTKYWIIADFNRMQDPLIKLEVGSVLKIPSIGSIKFLED